MMKVLLLMSVSGVISPVIRPSAARQYFGSPSHPSSDLPSNMLRKPGSSPSSGSGRSLCLGTNAPGCCARRQSEPSAAATKRRRLETNMTGFYIAVVDNGPMVQDPVGFLAWPGVRASYSVPAGKDTLAITIAFDPAAAADDDATREIAEGPLALGMSTETSNITT